MTAHTLEERMSYPTNVQDLVTAFRQAVNGEFAPAQAMVRLPMILQLGDTTLHVRALRTLTAFLAHLTAAAGPDHIDVRMVAAELPRNGRFRTWLALRPASGPQVTVILYCQSIGQSTVVQMVDWSAPCAGATAEVLRQSA
jgi:hypothetical protein